MKVLIVSEPGLDGVFRHVESLIAHLFKRGHTPLFAWSDVRTSDRLFSLVEEVNQRGGDTLRLHVGNQPGPADLAALLALRGFAKKHQPDVIHAHSSKAGLLARLLPLLGVRNRYFYTPHAYYRMDEPGSLKARVFHLAEKQLARVGRTINLSPGEHAFAASHLGVPKQRIVEIPNGVDTTILAPVARAEKAALRRRFGLPADRLLLGTVGRYSIQKDPLTLYRALAIACAAAPDLHFVHLGKGELEPEVEELVGTGNLRDRVTKISYLAQPAQFYQALDGFVLTSLYEGMSYAVLEALSTDLPVILTRAPGNNKFSQHGLSDISWCERGDPAGIAEAISVTCRAIRGGHPPNHRAVAERDFSADGCYDRVLAEYTRA